MPRNEILAPHYVKVSYNTGVANHSTRFYFETGSVLSPGSLLTPNDWTIRGQSAVQDIALSAVVGTVFSRMAGVLKSGTRINSIEVWQAAVGANLFLHNNDLPSTNTFGTAQGIAAAFFTPVFKAANRKQFRFSLFEASVAAPQRLPAVSPPTVDDNTFEWWFLKSIVPFATQDGFRLTSHLSSNVGYNRKLARSYGKTISP